jgi:gliding motility-associated-like protein
MRSIALIAVTILCCSYSKAQHTGNIWYFNDSLGLKFSDKTILKLNDGVTKLNGGTSVIAMDDSLVIYTDGSNAWNTEHNPIINGTRILGNGEQSSMFLQLKDDSVIHLFSSYFVGKYGKDSNVNGVYHSTIIPDTKNKNNFILAKTTKLAYGSNRSVTAKKASSFDGYWIIFPEWNTSNLLIYRLNENGLQFHRRENVLPQKHIGFSQLKISPNGRYVALMSCNIPGMDESICIYDFDNQKGTLSNYRSIKYFRSIGLEFSPSESFLYIMGNSTRFLTDKISRGIYQVNIDSIQANSTLNKDNSTFIYKTLSDASSMSITPHGQIFITYTSSGKGFSSIMNPDSFGISCDFRIDYIHFNNRPYNLSIPNICIDYILQPYFEIENGCKDSSICFKIHRNRADSITWIFGDGYSTINKSNSCLHKYTTAGVFKTSTILHYPSRKDTISKEIKILSINKPKLGNDTLLCKGEVLNLKITDSLGTTIVWNNKDSSSQYKVSYPESLIVRATNDNCSVLDTLKVSYVDCNLSIDSLCFGDSTSFMLNESNLDSAVFKLDNAVIKTSFHGNVKHKYIVAGEYHPIVRLYSNGLFKEIKDSINIIRIEDNFLIDTITACEPIELKSTDSRVDNLYTWNTGYNGENIEVGSTGHYWLRIERSGCYSIDSCFVQIEDCECPVYIPNSFSPNGDNLNDSFSIWTECEIEELSMKIYNRWGSLLIDNSKSWDGTYQNLICPFGVYPWTITYKDKNNQIHYESGTVHLIR